jgi:cobalamin biosynthesis Mg chelatase CobN
MSAKVSNQFGLSGQDFYDYNYFIRGKKGKKRKGIIRGAIRGMKKRQQGKNAAMPGGVPMARAVQELKPSGAPAVPVTSASTSNQPVTAQGSVNPSSIPANELPGNDGQVPGEGMSNIPSETEGPATDAGEEEEYSNFLGFGKKARAKRKLKNEEKKASIERTRAETQLMLSGTAPTPSPAASAVATSAVSGTQSSQGSETATAQEEIKPTEKSGTDMTTILIIVAGVVVVVGVGIVMITSKKPPAQKIAAQGL